MNMSIRFSEHSINVASAATQQNDDLWARLSGSPVVRPSTPSDAASSLHLDRNDDSFDMDLIGFDSSMILDEDVDHDTEHTLDSVVHLHELPPDFALAFFERMNSPVQIRAPNCQLRRNNNPVMPNTVFADLVTWTHQVSSSSATFFHRFELSFKGMSTAWIDVETQGFTIVSVRISRPHTSMLADAAGMGGFESCAFVNIETHTQKLLETMANIEQDTMYLPTNEIAVGSQLAVLRNGIENADACALWDTVCAQLTRLSQLALNCSKTHNAFEFTRTNSLV
jgi:hypothetical protein